MDKLLKLLTMTACVFVGGLGGLMLYGASNNLIVGFIAFLACSGIPMFFIFNQNNETTNINFDSDIDCSDLFDNIHNVANVYSPSIEKASWFNPTSPYYIYGERDNHNLGLHGSSINSDDNGWHQSI